MEFVQYRPLLDMHLDKAQVVAGVALQGRNAFNAQPGLLHGFAHADAIGIDLLQPLRFEVTCERARTQKSGLEALALLFGKGNELDTKGQALVLLFELFNAGQRHVDAQTPVVLATIAHGIKMAAGH